MVIERTKNEIIIRIPSFVKTEGIQQIIDYLAYKETISKSKATQTQVNKLSKEVKKGWWEKNKDRFVK